MTINHTANANPQRPKAKKLRIRKAIPMDENAPRRVAFREVIIPPKTQNNFKLKDVFEVSKSRAQAKQKQKDTKKGK